MFNPVKDLGESKDEWSDFLMVSGIMAVVGCIVLSVAIGVLINKWTYNSSAKEVGSFEIRCEIIEFYTVRSGKRTQNLMALVHRVEDRKVDGDFGVLVGSAPVGKKFLWVKKTNWKYRDGVIKKSFEFLRYE